jgi:hypothetical protein
MPGFDHCWPTLITATRTPTDQVYPRLAPEERPLEFVQLPGEVVFVPGGWCVRGSVRGVACRTWRALRAFAWFWPGCFRRLGLMVGVAR